MTFCLRIKKNGSLLHCSALCFFYCVASVNSVQATVVQFSTSCSSRLLFQLVFYNLLRKSDNLPPVIEIYAKTYPLYTRLSQHLVIRPKIMFSAHNFSQNSRCCCKSVVNDFAIYYYLCLT